MTRASDNCRISVSRNGRHRSRSSGVGLLAGGAHRLTAVSQAPSSRSPSDADTEVGREASPARWSAPNRKSPERSPVNMRPVRFAPCAAGARPTMSTRADASPNPGTGRPQ